MNDCSPTLSQCNQCGSSASRPLFAKHGYQLVRCRRCNLAYISNPPSDEELAHIYSNGADYHSSLFDPQSRDFAHMSDVAARHLSVVKRAASSGRLLDVGCSSGLFLDHARTSGFDVTGVEFSKDSATFAQNHFGLDVTIGDINALNASTESYDIITMFDVIEHVRDPSADIVTVRELLKPGGLFVVSTPNIDGLFPRLSYPVARLLDYWPHPEPPHHLYQFSVKTLTAMLKKGGFTVEAEHHTNIDLAYSFGSAETLRRLPKMAAYAALFAPCAKLGPVLKMGDWFYLTARKI